MNLRDITNRFARSKVNPDEVAIINAIRSSIYSTAVDINNSCPDSREKSLALTKLEEAMFWAITAVERNGVEK